MYMYTVIELQTWPDGTLHAIETPDVGHDPNKTDEENLNEALSEYYRILQYAAISKNPVHAAVVMRNDGVQVAGQCFKHEAEPAEQE